MPEMVKTTPNKSKNKKKKKKKANDSITDIPIEEISHIDLASKKPDKLPEIEAVNAIPDKTKTKKEEKEKD